MNSSQLFSFVFTTLVLFLFTSPQCSSLQEYSDGPAANSFPTNSINQHEKVDLFLYYESLCPGCATFISEYLVKVFEKGLIDIVNLRLVPWGNAKLVQPNDTIICQKMHFDFIRCLDIQTQGESIGEKEKLWRSCCQNLKLSELSIQECYSSGLGKTLVLQYGNETLNLIPPHEYVPWVTVNKKPIGDDMLNYKKHVCDAYKGSHVPEACKKLQPSTKTNNTDDHHEMEMSSNSVCYK
ncbi:hypothetical protein Ddye_008957 [Dipteronia dyeriana]|uniref:Gamma-interferon-inducible lysosomal thiol reductase n=1 Tax=Dipteronia dyeriana TaxID=168575 RepID=A0AAD9XAI1_9ROSI|nr:hypothetical protein Ddye_008957 [Dipteronia dyeriana]